VVQIHDCHGGPNQQWAFAGSQIRPAGAASLCLAFNNPLLTRPALRLASCGSSSRQQWSYESRSFADPVGYGHDDFIGDRVY
jgi:hypothetical protein